MKTFRAQLYFILLSTILLVTACYNDNGNYTYTGINEVGISFPALQSDSLQVAAGDSLKLNPSITFAGDKAGLSYEWKIVSTSLEKDPVTNEYPAAVVLATTPSLGYQIKQGPGQYMLIYTIKDNATGIKAFHSFIISVETLKGLLVLDEKTDGTNELNVIRDGRLLLNGLAAGKEGVAYTIFSGSNNGEKLKGAKSIYRSIYRYSASYVFDDDIYVFGNNLSLKLSTTNYKVTAKTMQDFFVVAPSSPDVSAQVMPKNYRELINIKGRLYCFSRTNIGNTKFGIDIAPSDNYEAAPFLPYLPISGALYSSIIFDKTNHCFRPVDMFGTSILTLSDTITKPYNLRNVNMELQYMENGNINYTYAVFHDPSNSNHPYLLVGNFAIVSGSTAFPKPIYKIDLATLPDIGTATDYCFSTKGHVMFYATPAAVYSATYRDGKYLTAFTAPAGEQVTKVKIYKDEYNTGYDGKLLIISTYNQTSDEGKIYIVQFNGANGVVDNTTMKSYHGFGKIVQWTVNN